MTERGSYTYSEILSQPEAWEAALDTMSTVKNLPDAAAFDQVIFTGCGSTYYLSITAAAFYCELTGRPARAFPASELWFNPQLTYPEGSHTLLIAVSRSGETSETIHACQDFKAAKRGTLVTLVNYPESPLASMGDLNIHLPSGQETSVCQTRAFSTLLLGTIWLTIQFSGKTEKLNQLRELPAAGRRLLDRYAALAKELGSDLSIDRFYFLGSGVRHGLACELSLKMKEMTLSHSEPFHFMEFRHGPKSMVTPSTLMVGLRSASSRKQEQAVLDDMKALGGRLIVLDNQDATVVFDAPIEEALLSVLYLPIGHLIAFWRAISKGLNPDRPNNLDSVVRLP
jgi:glucosamine--fructose-6-phosphate aminotransferase (isomerizing)